MARRKKDSDANPEEFLENRDEPEDRENLQEIIRGVKGSQGDDSLTDSPAIATAARELPAEGVDAQWEAGSSGDKTADAPDDAAVEAESEEPEWEPETETSEVLDDPVRMYLREIGRVRLLTSKDERVLARKIEGGKHLDGLESELVELEGRQPRPWEITSGLLNRMVAAEPLVDALGEQLGLPSNLTLSQITDLPTLRDAIDAEVSVDMLANIAETMTEEP
ncbi:MAG: hypothetical protein IIC99_04780, partial [Chloroflexi bacterium]|nr:hypothetical protein [Chloroflexota bacterium]